MSILCQLTNFYVDRTLIIQYEMPGDFIIIYKVTTIDIVIYIVIWSTSDYPFGTLKLSSKLSKLSVRE